MSKFKDLAPRLVSGLIGATIIVASIYLSMWSYLFIWGTILALTLNEYYQILKEEGYNVNRPLGIFLGVTLFLCTFFIQAGFFEDHYFIYLMPIFYMVFIARLYQKEKKAFRNLSYFFLGLIYLALPFSLINYLVFTGGDYIYGIFIGLMILTWANDVGAYFAGIGFGKTKLFERISPKKTWEGLMGGAILGVLVSLVVAYLFPIIPQWKWVVISQIITVTGTYGDLVESQFKRSIKIKDSGNAIPGHGGFMDRFDSMIISIPFVLFFLELF